MTRTTINDIADHVGVDKSTVSLVLRRKKTAMRISQLTQDRIFSAPKDLNYRPNVLARGLKGGQTHSVGIVWDMSVAQASVLMTRDLMVRIQNRQYVPYVIDNQSNFDKTLDSLSELANRGVDGVIVELPSPNLSDENLAELATRLKEFSAAVVVSKGPMALDVDQVVYDRFAAIHEVADYFVRTGRSRPCIISADYISGSKSKAFSSRLKERGLNMANDNIVYLTDLSRLSCGSGLADLCYETLNERFGNGEAIFDSILCSADEEAIAAIAWLGSKGLRVPQDVAVVGFNNDGSSKYAIPPLASVERRDGEVAEMTGKMLFARLSSPDLPIQTETVAMSFVRRESAGQIEF